MVFFQTGTLKYCGPTEFAGGLWAGIDLDDEAGKNDGSVGGISYFVCAPKHGKFIVVTGATNKNIVGGKLGEPFVLL